MIGRCSGARDCRGHVALARAAGGRGGLELRAWAIIVAAAILSVFLGAPFAALGQEGAAWDGVFQLLTLTPESRGITMGTAFFIDPSGLALTNSHVVYRAQHDPKNYVLFAVFHKEFYGVEIVCATHLESDAVEASEGPLGRDVAEIRLTPTKHIWWRIPVPGGKPQEGQPQFEARPHIGPLPYFPFFTLGDGPEKQGQVRVVGYGRASQTREKVVVAGVVTQIAAAQDGTPVFEIESADRPERGSSGSPVLNEQDRVVGMYTWNESKSDIAGLAISSTALATPCP